MIRGCGTLFVNLLPFPSAAFLSDMSRKFMQRVTATILLGNKQVFRDHQQQPIAVGELLADARRGLDMQQERLLAADSRLPLPAPWFSSYSTQQPKSENT
jgi:hypothetical protein